jgi:hypothetical protein
MSKKRRGASIQLDNSYFRGQELAVDTVEAASRLTERQDIAAHSRQLSNDIRLDVDSLARDTLRAASTQFRELLRQLPEVRYLRQRSPGTCFVIPEWMRSRGKLNYGARIYFFREDDAPAPTDVLERNIEAVVTGDRAGFERYQGALHGYPECCIDYFSGHERGETTGPELDAVEQITEYIDESAMPDGDTPSIPIGRIVEGIFQTPQVYAFFTREFFPEPDCDHARHRGIAIYDTLCDTYPERIVRDYFRINAGWSYLTAKATVSENRSTKRLSPGSLGREQLLFFLPLSVTLDLYQNGEMRQ